MIDFFLEKNVMGCHDNHAFSHMPNWFIYGDFLSRLGVPR